jgi:hypothetical protein
MDEKVRGMVEFSLTEEARVGIIDSIVASTTTHPLSRRFVPDRFMFCPKLRAVKTHTAESTLDRVWIIARYCVFASLRLGFRITFCFGSMNDNPSILAILVRS